MQNPPTFWWELSNTLNTSCSDSLWQHVRAAHRVFSCHSGEYVIRVHDSTDPPFLGRTPEPVYLLVRVTLPRNKKAIKKAWKYLNLLEFWSSTEQPICRHFLREQEHWWVETHASVAASFQHGARLLVCIGAIFRHLEKWKLTLKILFMIRFLVKKLAILTALSGLPRKEGGLDCTFQLSFHCW